MKHLASIVIACLLGIAAHAQVVSLVPAVSPTLQTNYSWTNQIGGSPRFLTEYNGILYFSARGEDTGRELYSYDGTSVSLAKQFRPGVNGGDPQYLTVWNNKLYMQATTRNHGSELWEYDGTAFTRLTDQNPNEGDFEPSYLTVVANKLYFSGKDSAGDVELWQFDGTTVSQVANFHSSGSSTPTNLVDYNGDLYCFASDTTGRKMWKHDGTSTTLVSTISNYALYETPMGIYNNELYFAGAYSWNNGRLYKYDGSAITEVKNGTNELTKPQYVGVANGLLYISSKEDPGNQTLLAYDGSTFQEVAVSAVSNYGFERITAFNNELYMVTYEAGKLYYTLHKYDGSTVLPVFTAFMGGNGIPASELAVYNGKLVFDAWATAGRELYQFDGTTGALVHDFVQDRSASVRGLACFNGALHGNAGGRLSRLDADTFTVLNDTLQLLSSSPMEELNGVLYFSAKAETGYELWAYDGAHCTLAAEIFPGVNASGKQQNSYPSSLHLYGNELVFSAVTPDGTELCTFDGTNLTTYDLYAGTNSQGNANSSNPQGFATYNGAVYFGAIGGAINSAGGRGLWKYDGSTVTHVDTYPYGSNTPPGYCTVYNNRLYMSARDATGDFELVQYDGSAFSEINVSQNSPFGPGYIGSDPRHLSVHQNMMYFSATDSTRGYELWCYNDTVAQQVEDYNVGLPHTSPNTFYSSGDQLFFSGIYKDSGYELLVYDDDGIRVVHEFREGQDGSGMGDWTNCNTTTYFTATTNAGGTHLHVLDACNPAANLRSLNVQNTNAFLDWDGQVGSATYKIRYKAAGSSGWQTQFQSSNTTHFLLSGLQPSTTYKWNVQTICNGTSGPISSLESFTTLTTACNIPTGRTTHGIHADKAKLKWQPEANSIKYRIRWRVAGSTTWTVVVKNGIWGHHWLTGLNAATTYEWQMRNVCQFGNVSGTPWSNLRTFTTATMKWDQSLTPGELQATEITIVPNPSNGLLVLDLEDVPQQPVEIRIVNALGQQVWTGVANKESGTQLPVDLSNHTRGIYFMQVVGAGGTSVQRLVLK